MKEEIKATTVTLDFVDSNSIEQLWMQVKVNIKSIALGVLYRSPNSPFDDLNRSSAAPHAPNL